MTFGSVLRRVWVTHRFVAMHAWPGAPERRAYLAHMHRHVFHVRLTVDVAHDDRDIEFHDLQDELRAYVQALSRPIGSCEQTALFIAERAQKNHPKRRVECDVSEDGENGATVCLLP